MSEAEAGYLGLGIVLGVIAASVIWLAGLGWARSRAEARRRRQQNQGHRSYRPALGEKRVGEAVGARARSAFPPPAPPVRTAASGERPSTPPDVAPPSTLTRAASPPASRPKPVPASTVSTGPGGRPEQAAPQRLKGQNPGPTPRVGSRTGPGVPGVPLEDDFDNRPLRQWGTAESARALEKFQSGASTFEIARAMRIDQFDVAEHLARQVYLAEGRVSRDASQPRFGVTYEYWEPQIMERWGAPGYSFAEIAGRLGRDRLGVAIRMIDLGIGSARTGSPSDATRDGKMARSSTANQRGGQRRSGRPRSASPAPELCPTCRLQLPTTGTCDYC